MRRWAAIRFLSLGGAFEGALWIILFAMGAGLGDAFYVPAIAAFVAGFLASAFVCGRSGLRLSGTASLAVCALAYIPSAPLAAWVESRAIPQDYGVLTIALLLWGIALVPLTALGCAVVNGAALGLARGN